MKFLTPELKEKYGHMTFQEMFSDCTVMTILRGDVEYGVYSQRKLKAKATKLTGKSHIPYAFRFMVD